MSHPFMCGLHSIIHAMLDPIHGHGVLHEELAVGAGKPFARMARLVDAIWDWAWDHGLGVACGLLVRRALPVGHVDIWTKTVVGVDVVRRRRVARQVWLQFCATNLLWQQVFDVCAPEVGHAHFHAHVTCGRFEGVSKLVQ